MNERTHSDPGPDDAHAFAEAWEQGRALTIDEAVALALKSHE